MPRSANPLMDIFIEGIEARSNGDAFEANPYLEAWRDREAWEEGWRLHDTLRKPAPAEEDIAESLVRRQRQ